MVFQGFDQTGKALPRWSIFADDFMSGASSRPTGLAMGPDGSLFVSADTGARIWRIRFVGT